MERVNMKAWLHVIASLCSSGTRPGVYFCSARRGWDEEFVFTVTHPWTWWKGKDKRADGRCNGATVFGCDCVLLFIPFFFSLTPIPLHLHMTSVWLCAFYFRKARPHPHYLCFTSLKHLLSNGFGKQNKSSWFQQQQQQHLHVAFFFFFTLSSHISAEKMEMLISFFPLPL